MDSGPVWKKLCGVSQRGPDHERGVPLCPSHGAGTIAQWHTQTRTGKVPALKKIYTEEACVEINQADAAMLFIREAEQVEMASRRAAVRVKAVVRDTVPQGEVFMPMHYFETKLLTYPAFDPYSREPAYKVGAVNPRKTSA